MKKPKEAYCFHRSGECDCLPSHGDGWTEEKANARGELGTAYLIPGRRKNV